MGDVKLTGEQGYDAQRTETNAGEIGSDSNSREKDTENNRLLFTNSCRGYYQFQLADD